MRDFLLNSVCDHFVRDEEILIPLPVTGTSQYYYDLRYTTDRNTVKVREWGSTEGLTNFNWVTDGVTDFTVTATRITFNIAYPLLSGVNHMDGATLNYPQNHYLVSYTVPLASCPKCSGDKRVNDIGFDSFGHLRVIEGKSRISQTIIKALLTEKGSDANHPEYGSILQSMVGKKMTAFTIVQLQQSIQSCIAQLMSYQAGYISDLPAEEIILGINSMTIEPDASDPRIIDIVIYVTTGNYDTIKTSLQLSV